MAASRSDGPQGVRFSDRNQEIEPPAHARDRDDLSPEAQAELRNLSITLQNSRLHASRMENFAFEPVSLPPSRTTSPNGSRPHSRGPSRRGSLLPGQSPPLTPAGTGFGDAKPTKPQPAHGASSLLTPQMSPPSTSRHGSLAEVYPAGPATLEVPQNQRVQQSRGSAGSRHASPAHSRDASPVGTPRSGSITSTTPIAQQQKPKHSTPADPRAVFGMPREPRRQSSFGTPGREQRGSVGSEKNETKHHGLFGSKRHHDHDDSSKHGGSMSDLKRFFRFGGGKHKDKEKDKSGHNTPEAGSRRSSRSGPSGTATPPHHGTSISVPFADDHGLEAKYGKFGKILGSGAGGSVRLMKRSSDGTTFAVKQFRPRHAYESEKEYNKKVTAEFCVGSTLHHGNIIETMDIIQEKGVWYEVMEYAPFDLFATVMTGKMSRDEVTCSVLQILSGVQYLHGMGLAHRDLKLDNVVISDRGIMKLIDFGSAVVFRYPFEQETVRASGIVGSDPYLAPEVYDNNKYDPQAVDMWSIAIIYCCMTLRRFPWKMPRSTDVSYKMFSSPPTPGYPTVDTLRRPSQAHSDSTSSVYTQSENAHKHHDNGDDNVDGGAVERTTTVADSHKPTEQPSIKGPWRLLRLLPRESRYIIGRMLDTNPETRATMEEIWADKWIASSHFCRQEAGGRVIRAPGHDHALEPGNAQPPAPNKKA